MFRFQQFLRTSKFSNFGECDGIVKDFSSHLLMLQNFGSFLISLDIPRNKKTIMVDSEAIVCQMLSAALNIMISQPLGH